LSRGADSPDVAAVFGEIGENTRFDDTIDIDEGKFDSALACIIVVYRDGDTVAIHDLASSSQLEAVDIMARFSELIASKPNGRLLEVGSRARSGITRRHLTPPGWTYQGVDVVPGPNVDIVGDAHELTSMFPAERFDAIMAFSVLEHLLMPWKFVIELNKVLNDGAIGLFNTNQCWPIHDYPWDFWRFSDQAWHSLLNPATGFDILDSKMSEPAFVVAQRCHAATNFGVAYTGFLASNVLFRKISTTSLTWPVKIPELISTKYPNI
jgi:hypothetical protein